MNPSQSQPPISGVPPDDAPDPARAGRDSRPSQSPLARYALRASHVWAVLLFAVVFGVLSYRPLWHTDLWGHLAFGRWIVEHRQLPDREPFSPFAAPTPCVHFQWLTQSGLYLLYHLGERWAGGDELHRLAGGAFALRAFFTAAALVRLLVLFFAYRRLTHSLPLACAGTLLVALVSAKVERPQVLGELLFACLLLALSSPVLSGRALIVIPICLVLWANLHGSYMVGLALLGVFLVGRLIETAIGHRPSAIGQTGWMVHSRWSIADSRARRLLLIVVLAAGGIALLNPHGPRLYLYTLQFVKHPNIAALEEWKPLGLHGVGGLWLYLGSLALLLVSQILSPRFLSPTSVLLLASFGVSPLFQQRMMSWWIVLVPWLALPLWAAAGERPALSWLRRQSAPSLMKTLMAVVLVLVAVVFSPPLQWVRAKGPPPLERSLSPGTPWKLAAQLRTTSDTATPPLPELADALKRWYTDGRFRGRIFASETQGDYLVWALPAEYPVLVYNHVHLFPPEHWRDCLAVKFAEPGWREVLDRLGVNLVLIEPEPHAQLAAALRNDPDWRVVLDETGDRHKPSPQTRLFVALRKHPQRLSAIGQSGRPIADSR